MNFYSLTNNFWHLQKQKISVTEKVINKGLLPKGLLIYPIQQFQLLKPQTQHDCDYLMQILSLFCMTIREKLNSRQMHIAHQEVNFTLTIHNNSVGVLCSMALSYRFWRNVTIYTTIYNIIYKGYHHMGRSQHALPQSFQHLNLRL